MNPRVQSAVALIGFLLAAYAAAFVGNLLTTPGLDTWYDALEKPSWTPPGSLIGAVWSVLYTLIGIAGWLAWRTTRAIRAQPVAMGLFGLQLVLNALWSPLFFTLHLPGIAFFEIILLEGVIIATIVAFWRTSRVAAALLLPYAAWVGFASYLNFVIWRLNV